MKIIEKISLALFANIILIISVLLCLVIFNWLSLDIIHEMISYAVSDHTISSVILGVCVVLILLAIKCIFFDASTSNQEKNKDGITLVPLNNLKYKNINFSNEEIEKMPITILGKVVELRARF